MALSDCTSKSDTLTALPCLTLPRYLQGEFREAMLPSVCAMALLPRTGKSYVPSALQHLMEAGSPVADVFDICGTCEQLAAENTAVNMVCSALLWQP